MNTNTPKNTLNITVVPSTDPVIQRCVAKFTAKTKHARLGHIGWIYQKLVEMNSINFVVTDENGAVRSVTCFTLDGKDEAVGLFMYSESRNLKEAKKIVEMVKGELMKIGVRKVRSIVWGSHERGKSAARLFGGEVVGTYVEIPI